MNKIIFKKPYHQPSKIHGIQIHYPYLYKQMDYLIIVTITGHIAKHNVWSSNPSYYDDLISSMFKYVEQKVLDNVKFGFKHQEEIIFSSESPPIDYTIRSDDNNIEGKELNI